MTSHRYPLRALAADYGRALFGMALMFGTLGFSGGPTVMVYILGGLGTLFLAFGARTFIRHVARVEVSTDAIRVTGPFGTVLSWRDLDALRVGYYSTRRDREGGWMQLKLNGGGGTVKLDSTIDGFTHIADRALAAAHANNLALDEATLKNLAALGIVTEEPAARA